MFFTGNNNFLKKTDPINFHQSQLNLSNLTILILNLV
jgi:hypothetical protein